MTIASMGFGAGTRELEARPNLTQVVVGTIERGDADGSARDVARGERRRRDRRDPRARDRDADGGGRARRVDHADPDEEGTPGAHGERALRPEPRRVRSRPTLTAETGSLGVRGQTFERWPSPRREDEVDVDGALIRVKVGPGRVKVEHDDAVRAARRLQLPCPRGRVASRGDVASRVARAPHVRCRHRTTTTRADRDEVRRRRRRRRTERPRCRGDARTGRPLGARRRGKRPCPAGAPVPPSSRFRASSTTSARRCIRSRRPRRSSARCPLADARTRVGPSRDRPRPPARRRHALRCCRDRSSHTAASLGSDGDAWRSLVEPIITRWRDLADGLLAPAGAAAPSARDGSVRSCGSTARDARGQAVPGRPRRRAARWSGRALVHPAVPSVHDRSGPRARRRRARRWLAGRAGRLAIDRRRADVVLARPRRRAEDGRARHVARAAARRTRAALRPRADGSRRAARSAGGAPRRSQRSSVSVRRRRLQGRLRAQRACALDRARRAARRHAPPRRLDG